MHGPCAEKRFEATTVSTDYHVFAGIGTGELEEP